jgi:hypothetical protein
MASDQDVTLLLCRTLRALEPWSDQVVLIGGWAMQLYRYLDGADSNVDVVLTKDVDFAVAKPLADADELGARLEREQLTRIWSRTTEPAITYFQNAELGSTDLGPSYAEFLTPLHGSAKAGPMPIAKSVTAQRLRYLDLSFQRPTSVAALKVPFLDDAEISTICIPSPASYLLGKALVYPNRKLNRKDKDCAYMYQLARITRNIWSEVRQDLDALTMPAKWRTRGYEQLRALFSREPFEGAVRAARSIADPAVHPERVIQAVMQRFLVALGVSSR